MLKSFKKTIYSNQFLDNYLYTAIRLFILNKVQVEKFRVFKILNILNVKPLENILKGYSYKSQTQNDIEINIPDLNLYLIKNAFINSHSSAIGSGNVLLYEAINNNERFNEGFVKLQNNKNALVKITNSEEISDGFFLAGNGSYNWYHWLMEILPKMIYFKEGYTQNILVDESCKKIASMAESLATLTKNLNLKIIYLDPQKTYHVKKLYFINEVNKLMFNTKNGNDHIFPIYYYRKEALKILAEKLQTNFLTQDYSSKKISIIRKNTHRIAKNETQISQLLQNYKFENIDLAILSLKEQINTFFHAEMLIGTTGAAWTNILFCKPNNKVIIFMPENYKFYQFYKEMAQMLNVSVIYLYYDNGTEDHAKSDFSIDLEKLENLLKNNHE